MSLQRFIFSPAKKYLGKPPNLFTSPQGFCWDNLMTEFVFLAELFL